MSGEALWTQFVAAGLADASALADAIGDPARLGSMAHLAFRVGLSSMLIGAEEVGQLALAIERALDRDGTAGTSRVLADAALHAAFVRCERSTAGRAWRAWRSASTRRRARTSFEARSPRVFMPPPASGPTATSTGTAFVWTPAVDDDMIDLFFDEASERVEALAGKLVEMERRPDDAELLRDVFRDMHTVKGSSAMVGLSPVNQLAHAAEDLVGQIRDSGRAADGAVVDALLAALDGLRDMIGQARVRAPITVDPAPIVARLRNPGAPAIDAPGQRVPSPRPRPRTPGPRPAPRSASISTSSTG